LFIGFAIATEGAVIYFSISKRFRADTQPEY